MAYITVTYVITLMLTVITKCNVLVNRDQKTIPIFINGTSIKQDNAAKTCEICIAIVDDLKSIINDDWPSAGEVCYFSAFFFFYLQSLFSLEHNKPYIIYKCFISQKC